jgi:kynurenine formamidase
MTRGVLIDVAGLKGVDTLPDTYEITVKDLQDALAKQRLTLQPGDAVLINTGWNRLWGKDNARYVKSCPGIGVAAAEWLAKQDPMLIGSDRNLKLDDLAAKQAYEFAFVMQPLKAQGFSGSTVAPVAIRWPLGVRSYIPTMWECKT